MGGGMQRWRVGEAVVTGVCEEQTDGIPPGFFFPEATEDEVLGCAWLHDGHRDARGRISLRVQAFVVELGGRTVVVDPCVGNGRERTLPFWSNQEWPWLERFEAAGFACDRVDTVVHTHLHADHVGWGTRPDGDGGWEPTFRSARYLYTERELASIQGPDAMEPNVWIDSVAPVLDAGLGDIVDEDADLGAGLRLEATTGHTPGHVSLWVESAGEVAMISGDWLHHPVQLAHPTWDEIGDADAEAARATRRRVLAQLADRDVLLLGTHFGLPSGGRVVTDGDRWRFEAVASG